MNVRLAAQVSTFTFLLGFIIEFAEAHGLVDLPFLVTTPHPTIQTVIIIILTKDLCLN
jgi:hypothetical protein